MTDDFRKKIVALEEFKSIVPALKKQGRVIVHCHGVFDLVHPGHIQHFHSAKRAGDVLIVTITADTYVQRGPGRPIFNQTIRTETLASLSMIDYVAIVHEPTAFSALHIIRPHVYAKGPDYKNQAKDITGKITREEKEVERLGGKLLITEDVSFSSSKLINDHLETYAPEVRTYLDNAKKKYTVDSIGRTLASLKKLKVLVIGESIIDEYHYCAQLGKSAKEPLVVHQFERSEAHAGGALATANHMSSMLGKVTLLSVLGKKNSQLAFIQKNLASNVRTKFFIRPDSETIVKRRYVSSAHGKKLFEICFMDDAAIPDIVEKRILSYLATHIASFDIVVANDFGHGLFTPRIISFLAKKAKKLAINVQTNSANAGFNLVTKYPRADYVCVDEVELRYATGDRFGELEKIAKEVQKHLHSQLLITTRGSKGALAYAASSKKSISAPALTDSVVDAVGAGDAFFAYSAPIFAGQFPIDLTLFLGNVAGAMAAQVVGNEKPVDLIDAMKFVTRLLK